MLLNRIYDEQDLERFKLQKDETIKEWKAKFRSLGIPEELVVSFAGQVSETIVPLPLISGVEVLHTGVRAEQNFSTSLITEFIKLGIAEINNDELVLHTSSDDLKYTILRSPGRWCLHCKEKLTDDATGEMARLHIAMKHNGVPSPVESEPSGYVWLTYFECVLDEGQHAEYKVGAYNG